MKSLFLLNVRTYLQVHTALQPRRQKATSNVLTIYEVLLAAGKEKTLIIGRHNDYCADEADSVVSHSRIFLKK